MWLCLDRVKDGYARKRAHMWHGPFRLAKRFGNHAVRLEFMDTLYHLFQVANVSMLTQVKILPERTRNRLNVNEPYRLNVDEIDYRNIAVKKIWSRMSFEKMADVHSGQKTH